MSVTPQGIIDSIRRASEPTINNRQRQFNPWPDYKSAIIALAGLLGPINGATGVVQLNAQGQIPAALLRAIFTPLTQAQRDALTPALGRAIWNTDSGDIEVWDGIDWKPIAPIAGTPTGLSSPLNVGVVAANDTANIDALPVAKSYFDFNSLAVEVSATPGVSTFDIALYASQAQRDAAVLAGTTFDAANRGQAGGLVYLALGVAAAAAGPATSFADALGVGYSNEPIPSLYGVIRNNDGANGATFSVAVATDPRAGSKTF